MPALCILFNGELIEHIIDKERSLFIIEEALFQ